MPRGRRAAAGAACPPRARAHVVPLQPGRPHAHPDAPERGRRDFAHTAPAGACGPDLRVSGFSGMIPRPATHAIHTPRSAGGHSRMGDTIASSFGNGTRVGLGPDLGPAAASVSRPDRDAWTQALADAGLGDDGSGDDGDRGRLDDGAGGGTFDTAEMARATAAVAGRNGTDPDEPLGPASDTDIAGRRPGSRRPAPSHRGARVPPPRRDRAWRRSGAPSRGRSTTERRMKRPMAGTGPPTRPRRPMPRVPRRPRTRTISNNAASGRMRMGSWTRFSGRPTTQITGV